MKPSTFMRHWSGPGAALVLLLFAGCGASEPGSKVDKPIAAPAATLSVESPPGEYGDQVINAFTGEPIPGATALRIEDPPRERAPQIGELPSQSTLEALFDLLRRGVSHPLAPAQWRVGGLAPYATLHQAVAAGDYYAVVDRLSGGADLQARDANGRTPLLVAAEENRPFVASLLLEQGASVEDQDALGNSILHLTARASHLYSLENFRAHGAAIEARNHANYTPLHVAAEAGDILAIDDLVRMGADTYSLQDPNVLSIPAVLAARARNWEVMRYFRSRGLYFSFHAMAAQGDIPGVLEALAEVPDAVHMTDVVRNTPLLSAIYTGETEMVRLLIAHGGDLHAGNQSGYTPLAAALRYGRLECARALLDAGVDINQSQMTGFEHTLLNDMVRSGSREVLAFMLENGANPNLTDENGRAPLHVTIDIDDPDKAQLLVQKGASPIIPNAQGWPACVLAAQRGQTPMLEIFSVADGLLNTTGPEGCTLLHAAAENGHVNTVVWLVKHHAALAALDQSGCTALHLAADSGHAEVAKILLEAGAAVDEPDVSARTALLAAAAAGQQEVLQVLVERGASLERVDGQGRNALYLALQNSHIQLARMVHERGGSEKTRDNLERSVLFPAVTAGDVGTVAWLLDLGLSPIDKDKNGVTPLHMAVREGDFATVQFLLDHGASLDAQDSAGVNPLHRAAERGNLLILQLLLRQGAVVSAENEAGRTPIHFAAAAGRASSIRMLRAAGSSVNAVDRNGATPLLLAAKTGHVESVRELLYCGALVQMRSHDGVSPLDAAKAGLAFTPTTNREARRISYVNVCSLLQAVILEAFRAAATEGDVAAMSALLDSYPDFKEIPTFGFAPAHWAAQYGQVEILKLLHAHGVDLHQLTQTEQGYAPLHLAVHYNHPETAAWLLEAGVPATLRSALGQRAMDLAAAEGHEQLVQILGGP